MKTEETTKYLDDIVGSITIADTLINFSANSGENKAFYIVRNLHTGEKETRECSSQAFLKALAIMIHNDGMPNYETDYPDAEAVQPNNPNLRFIP
jgi:hypothetical protein